MVFNRLTEPKEENVDQIQLYLHYFRISKGILLYVNKDNQYLKEFIVEYDKRRANCLIKSLNQIKRKIEKNILPARLDEYPKIGNVVFVSLDRFVLWRMPGK